jgi:UDP-N-acetylglucosamine 2-epimerase (non-hydrolysing)
VLVIRYSTERPEAVKAGFAEVVGVEKQGIIEAISRTLTMQKQLPLESPYGDGNAADRIISIVRNELET